MAFCTTYKTILDHNIKHLYSGYPTDLRFRKATFPSNFQHARRMPELELHQPDRFQRKHLDYIANYNICLPKAPAFRLFTADGVNDMVKRVSRPTCSAKSKRDICKREAARHLHEVCTFCVLSKMPYKVTKQEMENINKRLLQPTIATTIRNNMRDKRRFSLHDVHVPCEKTFNRCRPVTRSGIRSAP